MLFVLIAEGRELTELCIVPAEILEGSSYIQTPTPAK